MANERVLTLKITGDASGLARAFGRVDRDASKMQRGLSGVRRGLLSIGPPAAIAAAAVAAAGAAFVKMGLDGAIAQERLNSRTQNVLRTMGQGAGRTAEQIEGLATSIERATGSDGQVVQAGANLVLTFANIRNAAGEGNDVFDQTVKLANDMSVALGTGMEQSSMQLGKALNDPIRGLTQLRRVGVSFTDQQQDQVKAMVASGDTMGAQKIILGELEKQFGDAAASEGPLTEATQRLSNMFGEASEAILVGALPAITAAVDLITTRVVPVISDLAERVAPLIGQAMEWVGQKIGEAVAFIRRHWDTISTGARDAWSTVVAVIERAIGAIGPIISDLVDMFRSIWPQVRPVVAEARRLMASLGEAITTALDGVRRFWDRWGEDIISVVRRALKVVLDVARPALATLRSAVETITALIEGDWSGAWEGIKGILRNALRALVAAIRGVGGLILSAMQFVAGKAVDGLKALPGLMLQAGKNIVDKIIEGIKAAPGKIKDAIIALIPTPADLVSELFGGNRTTSRSLAAPPPSLARGANGMMLPGTYQGRDTMLIAAAPGEAILTPRQQSLVESGVPIRRALAMTGGAFAAGGFVQPVRGGAWSGSPADHHRRALGNWQSDDAWDIFPRGDDNVYASFSGSIPRTSPFSSNPGTWGYAVYLSGAPGTLWYKHLKSTAVSAGQSVNAGAKLGTLGEGVSGGKHLHLGAQPVSLLDQVRAGGPVPGGGEPGESSEGVATPAEQATPPPLTDRQKLADLLGKATGRPGLGTGAGKPVSKWARPLVNTLTTDVPDVSSSAAGTNYTGAQGRNISGAARKARTAARRAGKSPEEVREEGEAAEREAELKVLRINRREVIQKRAALRKAKQRLLTRWSKLTRKPAKNAKARAARKKAQREINAKLREYTAEINDLTEIIAEIAERMREIGEDVVEAAHDANYEAVQEAERAAEEAARAADGGSGEAPGSVGAGPEAPAVEPPTTMDYLNLAALVAAQTEGTEDDLEVARAVEQIRIGEFNAATATQDPRQIMAALQNLLAIRQQITALTANTEALTENTQAMQGLTGSVTFGFRGQDYVLGSLAPPSSDRIENILVGA